ncbi:MAG: hypothetical protein UT64_C0049G0003 [Candidatus Falkowbacteria bacterium GW2011_GWF2_39_8]|uniref:Integral membrane protein n=1 Tax=Candidatus Falkowbacteria bacterium GW2011_GWF2_39_8 TaxID=1618642 RepID=A0A0G0PUI5_9BACT|nr:MAG: hypothetical protein UT64_C0049G0003 [Candidatus Falkowbacteria bacterium GW2011_GWF2_39_8]
MLVKWLILTASILGASYLIPGVEVSGLWPALILAIVIGIINLIIRPILIIITLPINILTLGLFTFVINALLILLASSIVKGFEVGGFFNALLFSIIVSFFNFILSKLLDPIN